MLSPLAGLVRRHDPDRFLTALFAPPERRETLFVLYAFNHELARAREVTSHPTLALLRLQWWREIVEGAERQHEIAAPLRAALAAGALAPDLLLRRRRAGR
jgi:phytoene synthase